MLIISGTVIKNETGDKLVGARILHPRSRVCVRSDTNGKFKIALTKKEVGKKLCLFILMSNYWPMRISIEPNSPEITLAEDRCILTPISDIFTKNLIGSLLSLFVPRLVYLWYTSTKAEKILSSVIITIIFPPVFLFLIDRGLQIPFTDNDEFLREQIQRAYWLPSKKLSIKYNNIREYYFKNIEYELPKGIYNVKKSGVTIENGSILRIKPGVEFVMEKGSFFLVKGILQAIGSNDEKIEFTPKDSSEPWQNITFWDKGSLGSELSYCIIKGGTGRKCEGQYDKAGFYMNDKNGTRVGGGVSNYPISCGSLIYF